MGKMPKMVQELMAEVVEASTAEQTSLAGQLAAVQSEIASLRDRLLMVTDEVSFDAISAEIVVLEKKAAILAAKQRVTDWQEAERLKLERLTAYKGRVDRVAEISMELDRLDEVIFDALEKYAESYAAAYDLHCEASQLVNECKSEASELDREVPEIRGGPVFGLRRNNLNLYGQIGATASDFFLQWGAVKDARKKGIPVEKFTIAHVKGPIPLRFNSDGSVMVY